MHLKEESRVAYIGTVAEWQGLRGRVTDPGSPGSVWVRIRFDGQTSDAEVMRKSLRLDEDYGAVMASVPQDANPKDAVGRKKVDMALIPPSAKIHQAHAFMDGAAKYGPYNWREKKVSAMVYLGAMMRHIDAYLDGEDTASDSGCHHLGHAQACAGIILDAAATGNLIDDRPNKGAAASLQAAVHKLLVAADGAK